MERQSDCSFPAGPHSHPWSEERCQKTFGAGDYRAGWYLLDDDAIELDDPTGWEPLVHDHACFENETMSLSPDLELNVLPPSAG
jgi:hypothetical protein